jgi:uncharacterized protein
VTPAERGSDLADVLRPRTEADTRQAIDLFARAVKQRFDGRLTGLYLFGSRARGDHRRDSDVDIAVVIEDGDWSPLGVSIELAGLAFEPLVHTGIDIQPRAVPASHWADPARDADPALLRRMQTDATPLAVQP